MRRFRWAVGLVAALTFGCGPEALPSDRVQAGSAGGPEASAGRRADADPMATLRGRVYTEEHQFYVVDDGEIPSFPNGSNGLADPGAGESGGVIIHVGIASGDVWVSVEARGAAPPSVDLAGWEEVVEVSVRALGRLDVAAMAADVDDPFPVLNPEGAGDHRLRVHARGRDHNIDGVDFEPVEEYLLVMWPGPPAPEVAHKQTDAYGAQSRRSPDAQPALPTGPPPTGPPQRSPGPRPGGAGPVVTVFSEPRG